MTEGGFVEVGRGEIAQNQNKVFNYHTLLFTHKYKHPLNPHALLHSHLIIVPLYPKCCLTFRNFCLYIRTGISWREKKNKTKQNDTLIESSQWFETRQLCAGSCPSANDCQGRRGKKKRKEKRQFSFVAAPSWAPASDTQANIPPVTHERFWSELRGDLKAVTVRNDPSLRNQPPICPDRTNEGSRTRNRLWLTSRIYWIPENRKVPAIFNSFSRQVTSCSFSFTPSHPKHAHVLLNA